MAISNINETYSKIISNIASNTARVVDNTRDSSNTGNNNLTDSLELNSSISDLSSYLNYSSNGRYSSPSLADFLSGNSDSEDNNTFSLLETDTDSDSLSSAFEELADAKTKEVDDLISKALNKLNNSESE